MEFIKAHGTANDFVLLPDPDDAFELTPALVRALCDRRRGVGGDGVIRLAPDESADVFMDYRNADGSLAEMCGNGVRCVAKYVADRSPADGDVVRVGTRAGVKPVRIVERHADGTVARVRVDMGAPSDVAATEMTVAGHTMEVTTLSMGNPHAVLVVDDVAAVPLEQWAASIAERFPDGVNVEVIEVPSPERVIGRVRERGVGETMSSGTGASAMAVAARFRGLTAPEMTVSVPGGDLVVSWSEGAVLVTGPAEEVASGTLDSRWLALAGSDDPARAEQLA